MLAPVFAYRTRFVLFVVAALGALFVHPSWARSVSADVWNVPALQEQMRDARSERDRLDAEDEEVRRRIAVKDAIAGDLLADRITLAEAVERFAEIIPSRSKYMAAIRDAYPGATDHEKLTRHAIAYTVLCAAPPKRAATANRLEADLVRTPRRPGAR